jgi:membrane-associated phospholipid phosphatase
MIQAIENSDSVECKIVAKAQEKRTKLLNYFWKFWSLFGLPYFWIILGLIYLLLGNLLIPSLFSILFIIYIITIAPLKIFVKRPRPQQQCDNVQSLSSKKKYSFPSGHTFIATAFGLVMAFQLRGFLWFMGMLILGVMVAASRIYLGAHFLTDVVFSYVVAIFVVLMIFSILFPLTNIVIQIIQGIFFNYS